MSRAGLAIILAALVAGGGTADAGRRNKSKTTQSKASCYKALDALGVDYSKTRRRYVQIAVRIRGPLGGVTYKSFNKKPLIIDCSLAVSLAAVGPFLTAQGIETATFSSAYSVRNIRGTRRRSRHSFGRAIDVHSFTGPNIGTLQVKNDYEQGLGDAVDCIGHPLTQGGQILRAVNCQMRRSGLFHNLLDPDYDADHYNHFHLATERWTTRTDDPLLWHRRAAEAGASGGSNASATLTR
jgi:hypothetical protein